MRPAGRDAVVGPQRDVKNTRRDRPTSAIDKTYRVFTLTKHGGKIDAIACEQSTSCRRVGGGVCY